MPGDSQIYSGMRAGAGPTLEGKSSQVKGSVPRLTVTLLEGDTGGDREDSMGWTQHCKQGLLV